MEEAGEAEDLEAAASAEEGDGPEEEEQADHGNDQRQIAANY